MESERYMNATSKTDLCNILSKCADCYQSTNNGNLIVSHIYLPRILVNSTKKKKRTYVNLVVNSKSNNDQTDDANESNEQPVIGHWFLITVTLNRQPPTALLCDPLNEITKNSTVMDNINMFCKFNSLKLLNLNEKFQSDNSFYCGYISMGLISYTHNKKKTNKIMTLKKLFQRNSVRSNEKLVLKMYEKHFLTRHSNQI